MPGAGAMAPVAGVMAAAPAGEGDTAAASFLEQLKAAVTALANVAGPLGLVSAATAKGTPTTTQDGLPLLTDPAAEDADSEVLPIDLAALGLVLPPPVPTLVLTEATTAGTGAVSEASQQAGGASQQAASLTQTPLLAANTVQSGQTRETLSADATLQSDVQTAQPADTALDATALPNTSESASQAPAASPDQQTPIQPASAPTSSPTLTAQAVPTTAGAQHANASRDAEGIRVESTPASDVRLPDGSAATELAAAVQASQSGAFQSNLGGDGASDDSAQRPDAIEATSATAPATHFMDALDPSSAAAPLSAPDQAAAARPAEVVAQIAQQAELYRLPGARGVRIQLNPDGLGGVEVTLRYSPAGTLQLHLAVEHQSTRELVEAGWSDLRDALGLQGIAADRLVMSVAAPPTSGGATDGSAMQQRSSSDGSFGAAGQQMGQGDRGGQRSSGGSAWGAVTELANTPRDEARSFAADSTSRIDYRV
jgi:flagellar hook-length control protein FliK